MLKSTSTNQHGGKRTGAGRPMIGSTKLPTHSLRCTDEEYAAIKEFLAQRRSIKAPAEGEK